MEKKIKKIMVIHQGALGDMLMSLPALYALKKEYGSSISLYCGGGKGLIAKKLGVVEKYFSTESKTFSSLYTRFVEQNFQNEMSRYDFGIYFGFSLDLEQKLKNLIPDVVRIPPRPEATKQIHTAVFLYQSLMEKGLLSKNHFSSAGIFEGLPVKLKPAKKTRVLIHPGAGSPRKCWPCHNFLKVFNELEKQGIKADILLGPAEKHLENFFKEAGCSLILDTGIQSLFNLLLHCRGFIGNDSGVAHLAAIIGIPVTAVFGPSDSLRWHPPGPEVTVVTSNHDCQPCFETKNMNCETEDCLKKISPDKVLNAFFDMIDSLKS